LQYVGASYKSFISEIVSAIYVLLQI